MMLARISAPLASGCRFMVVHGGTNDVVAGAASYDYTVTTGNLQSIYTQLLLQGITPIAVPITPRSADGVGGLLSVSKRRQIYRINQWIRKYCAANNGVLLADPTKNIVDYSATGSNIGDPIGGNSAAATAYTYDGLHASPLGAWAMGKAIADALTASGLIGSTRNYLFENPIDTYHATDNPTGNLLSNGAFVGTAGALAGGATGTVADSWTLQKLAGVVAGSKGTDTLDNGTTFSTQIITLGAAGLCKLYEQVYAPAYLTVGDQVYLEMNVQVSSGVQVLECHIQLDDATVTAVCNKPSGTFYMPPAWSGVLRTPVFTLTSIAVVTAFFEAKVDAAGSGVFELGKASWRKVVA